MYSESSVSSSELAAPVTMPSYPNITAKPCSRFEITVTDPERRVSQKRTSSGRTDVHRCSRLTKHDVLSLLAGR